MPTGSSRWSPRVVEGLHFLHRSGLWRFCATTFPVYLQTNGFNEWSLQLSVPTHLTLLPGQLHMLKEAVELEKERIKSSPAPNVDDCSNYITVQADMPGWVATRPKAVISQFGQNKQPSIPFTAVAGWHLRGFTDLYTVIFTVEGKRPEFSAVFHCEI